MPVWPAISTSHSTLPSGDAQERARTAVDRRRGAEIVLDLSADRADHAIAQHHVLELHVEPGRLADAERDQDVVALALDVGGAQRGLTDLDLALRRAAHEGLDAERAQHLGHLRVDVDTLDLRGAGAARAERRDRDERSDRSEERDLAAHANHRA
jgi:hypothetical protein